MEVIKLIGYAIGGFVVSAVVWLIVVLVVPSPKYQPGRSGEISMVCNEWQPIEEFDDKVSVWYRQKGIFTGIPNALWPAQKLKGFFKCNGNVIEFK